MDVGVDVGMEQVPLTGDFLLPSMVESSFGMGKSPALDAFLDYRGMVSADFGYDTDVLESGEGVVYEEMLGEMGVEGGEVIVLARDAGGSGLGWRCYTPSSHTGGRSGGLPPHRYLPGHLLLLQCD